MAWYHERRKQRRRQSNHHQQHHRHQVPRGPSHERFPQPRRRHGGRRGPSELMQLLRSLRFLCGNRPDFRDLQEARRRLDEFFADPYDPESRDFFFMLFQRSIGM